MCVIPLVTQMFTGFITQIIELLKQYLGKIRFGPKMNSISIRYMSEWNNAENSKLQFAILDKLNFEKVLPYNSDLLMWNEHSQNRMPERKFVVIPIEFSVIHSSLDPTNKGIDELFVKYQQVFNKNDQQRICGVDVSIIVQSVLSTEKIKQHLKQWQKEYDEREEKTRLPQTYFGMATRVREEDRLRFDQFLLDLQKENIFDQLVYPEKNRIIQLINDLEQNTIDRVGIFIQGEPGIGKTSTIKAIAQKTGRHIVDLKLSNVQNIAELRQILFDSSIDTTTNHHHNTKVLAPKNTRIFVLEDADVDCPVILIRNKDENVPEQKKEEILVQIKSDETKTTKEKQTLPDE